MAEVVLDAPAGSARGIAPGEGGVLGKTGFAWAWFEAARNPYYILIVIYVVRVFLRRRKRKQGRKAPAGVAQGP